MTPLRCGVQRDNVLEHPLVLPWRLLSVPPGGRADRVAGMVCRAMGRDLEVEDWLGTISRIDVRAQRARADLLVHAPAAVPVDADELGGLRLALAERDEEIARLRSQLAELNALFEHASDELTAAGKRATAAERERDRFEQEADLARARADVARADAKSAHDLDGAADAVRLAASAFGEALVLLDSAYESAEESGFRQPRLLFKVLSVLAMTAGGSSLPLHETLLAVCGRQARWKPKDSPQTMKAWGSDREFTSSTGGRVSFESHVTLGHGVKPGASMQVYYRTLTDGRVEVAYAGTHLRTVSHDS